MPIETPIRPPNGSKSSNAEFVLCQGFVFRLSNVDACSHQTFDDGSGVTTVNFKSYTQSIPDPDRRLFDFLTSKLNPTPIDENF